jgi:hypothetical protein
MMASVANWKHGKLKEDNEHGKSEEQYDENGKWEEDKRSTSCKASAGGWIPNAC